MFPLVISLAAFAGDLPDVDTALKTGTKSDKDAAVVIGIEDYLKIPDVPYAQRDAKAMYDFLVYTRGVPAGRIRLLDGGASREQIAEAITAAGSSVSTGGTVWVYFAGHGAADPSSGERMLLGDDVRADPAAFASRGIGLSEVKKLAGKGGGAVNLIVDACYSGVGRGGQELVAGKRFAVPVRSAVPTSSVLEWNAASADQMSGPLEPARHGAFTYFVIGAMRGWADGQIDGKADGKVTAEEANLYVADSLRAVQITGQKPEMAIASAKDRVLSTGAALEKAPALSASSATTTTSTASKPATSGVLDVENRAQTLAWLTERHTACYDRLAVGHAEEELRRLYVRVRVKKGPKVTVVASPPDLTYEHPLAPMGVSIATCVQNDVKAAKWASPQKSALFADTIVVPVRAGEKVIKKAPPPVVVAPAVAPVNPAPVVPTPTGPAVVAPAVVAPTVVAPAVVPTPAPDRVTLVFKSKDGAWLDILVDGDKVEFRGSGQPSWPVSPGKHKIEVYAFLGKEVLGSTTVDTGAQKSLSIGVAGSGAVECYNCATPGAPAASSAPLPASVTVVVKSKDGTWVDVLVDGERLKIYNSAPGTVTVSPGKHKIEVYPYLGTTALSSKSFDTGAESQVSIGVDGAGVAECYNCPGN